MELPETAQVDIPALERAIAAAKTAGVGGSAVRAAEQRLAKAQAAAAKLRELQAASQVDIPALERAIAAAKAAGVERGTTEAAHEKLTVAKLDAQLRHRMHAACIVSYDDSRGHTTYCIHSAITEPDGGCSRVSSQHRFREFLALHKEIQPLLSSLPVAFTVPKRWFHPTSVKEARVAQLQKYLVDALGVCGPPSPVAALSAFLGRTDEEARRQGAERQSAKSRLQTLLSGDAAQADIPALGRAIAAAKSAGVDDSSVRAAEQRLAKANAKRDAVEKARREAEEQARREAEEKARREAEERMRRQQQQEEARQHELRARCEAEERARRDAAAQQLQRAQAGGAGQAGVAALDAAIAAARGAGVDRTVVLAAERSLEEAALAQVEPQLLRNLEQHGLEGHTARMVARGLGTCAAVVELSIAALSAALGVDAAAARRVHEAAAMLPAEVEEARWQQRREQIAAQLQEVGTKLAARDEELRGQLETRETLHEQQRAAAGQEDYREAQRLKEHRAGVSQQILQAEASRSELVQRQGGAERELREWQAEEARRVRDRERATQADNLQTAVQAAEGARHLRGAPGLRAAVAAARKADVDVGLVQAAERVLKVLEEKQRSHEERRARPDSELHRELLRIADQLGGLYQLAAGRAGPSRFLLEPRQLVFGQPVEAARGVEHYMNVDTNDVRRGMIDGVAAIRREVALLPDGKPDGYWNAGAVVKECLEYVLDKEAGSDPTTFQGGLKRDCDAAGNLLHVCDRAGTVLNTRRRRDGRGMRLADFLDLPVSRDCRLEEGELAGLRLYSTAAYEFLNNPLRDQDRRMKGEPHPLPITVAFIREGLRKLRAVAATRSEQANQQVDLYRGMKDVAVPADFLDKGGTELAPMSTTSNLKVRRRIKKP
jgi:hypothetical protein